MIGHMRKDQRQYSLFSGSGLGWLEVPRHEVVASGATISTDSLYDPVTDMAYLETADEEKCDATAFLEGTSRDWGYVRIEPLENAMPGYLSAYEPGAIAGLRLVPGGRGHKR